VSALAEILERRARLLAEAEAQRQSLAEGIDVCRSVLVVVDRGIAWATWLRARPYLVVLRPRLALRWSARLLTLWRVGRVLLGAIRPAAGDQARPDRSAPEPQG